MRVTASYGEAASFTPAGAIGLAFGLKVSSTLPLLSFDLNIVPAEITCSASAATASLFGSVTMAAVVANRSAAVEYLVSTRLPSLNSARLAVPPAIAKLLPLIRVIQSVNAEVSPTSASVPKVIGKSGSSKFGFSLTSSASFQLVICPDQIFSIASGERFTLVMSGRFTAITTASRANGTSLKAVPTVARPSRLI